MTNVIYAPRLEYVSESDNPEKELLSAIESVCQEEHLAKYFGYLFSIYDKFRMVFIVNNYIFEMDVMIKGKNVIILKGSFNDIKMYLVARLANYLKIPLPENAFQYIERRITSIFNSIHNHSLEIHNEISLMDNLIHRKSRNGDCLNGVRTNLKRFMNHEKIKKEMETSQGFGVRLSHYLLSTNYILFSHHIFKLYLICAILDYPEVNPICKTICRIILLEYTDIEYDMYPEILYDIAEWIYVKYFEDNYSNSIWVDMNEVD